ncbi:MAG: YggS family pyridoxal phosphate-dependent enzyme [Christensenellaceae bacterium]|jgi:pyridoxal phosphate enzyme (YggS family)|nr:YggS family pyridoxal phosphate-dependent enzyme [Christensenellaceae bacterium]
MCIAENYLALEANIAEACRRSGRPREEVRLIAVTKYVEMERIDQAVRAGAREVGENRAQELVRKMEYFDAAGVKKHLIGQLQTNKVKYILGKVELIQSVDRLELAHEISRLAAKQSIEQGALVEVNIGGEAQKGGISPKALPEFLSVVSALPGIRVKGLMCIPPLVGEADARRYFAAMKRLFDQMAELCIPNVEMRELSMGMSGDYMAAILEGATMVRVGTALFGARDKL